MKAENKSDASNKIIAKFLALYEGPYRIKERKAKNSFILENPQTKKVRGQIHASSLKVWEVCETEQGEYISLQIQNAPNKEAGERRSEVADMEGQKGSRQRGNTTTNSTTSPAADGGPIADSASPVPDSVTGFDSAFHHGPDSDVIEGSDTASAGFSSSTTRSKFDEVRCASPEVHSPGKEKQEEKDPRGKRKKEKKRSNKKK